MIAAARAWGVGTEGRLGASAVARLAVVAERVGFDNFWFNSPRFGESPVDVMRLARDATSSIEIGVGVVPLDRFPADGLSVQALSGDCARLILGLGSGGRSIGAIDLVTHGVETVRAGSPSLRVALGGKGPKMMALAGRSCDAVCLSMVSAQEAARAVSASVDAAKDAGRETPTAYLYHRIALGSGAENRIRAEMAAYGVPLDSSLMGTPIRSVGDLDRDLGSYPDRCVPVLRPLLEDPRDIDEWEDQLIALAALIGPA